MENLISIVKNIEEKLIHLATPEALKATRKFIPHVALKDVFGVRMPAINQLANEYKGYGLPLAVALWEKGAFEERLLAAKILERAPIGEAENILKLIDRFKDDISNWAVCDALGMQAIKKSVKRIPDQCFDQALRYISTHHHWTIRLGLVYFTHFARRGERLMEISAALEPLSKHEEYYVRKAVVWVNSIIAKQK